MWRSDNNLKLRDIAHIWVLLFNYVFSINGKVPTVSGWRESLDEYTFTATEMGSYSLLVVVKDQEGSLRVRKRLEKR